MKVLDNNGVEVMKGDWVRSSDNDMIPAKVDHDEDGLFITTYHSKSYLKDNHEFYKCKPCKAERCCDDFGNVRCTYQESCE